MNLIFISNENNFLHVSNDYDNINYTFYDSNGILLDGGQTIEIDESNKLEDIAQKLIEAFDLVSFTEPYIKLEGIQADNFIELIEEQDYKNMQSRVSEYLKNIEELELEI